MNPTLQRRLTLTAAIGLAHWLFGNLYEAVVFSPNWVGDSPAQLARLDGFFAVTSPTLYFVPLTMLALVLLWALWWRNENEALAADYRRAGITALVLAALTAYIVSAVIPRMFGADALAHSENMNAAAWQWNILNVLRMILTATTAYYTFNAFRKLDRM
jgi:branched-subunit amino acid transport protein